MGCARNVLPQDTDEPGFADTGFARYEHHVPLTLCDVFPTLAQEGDFRLAPDQRCQASGGRDIQPMLRATLAQDAIDPEGCGHALEGLRTALLADEVALGEVIGRR